MKNYSFRGNTSNRGRVTVSSAGAVKAPSYASSKLWLTGSLTGVKCRATSVAKNSFDCFQGSVWSAWCSVQTGEWPFPSIWGRWYENDQRTFVFFFRGRLYWKCSESKFLLLLISRQLLLKMFKEQRRRPSVQYLSTSGCASEKQVWPKINRRVQLARGSPRHHVLWGMRLLKKRF